MDMMVIIETMVKLLLLMALGFFLNKLGIFSRESNRMLSDLIVKVTTPLLIISSVCETGGEDLNRLSILPVLGGAFILYLALIAAGELIARLPFFPKTERDATACMLVFSNNSFMGIPVLESLYGSSSIFYNSIINFPFFIFLFTYGVFRLSGGKQKFNLKSILTPGVISALVALVIFLTGDHCRHLRYGGRRHLPAVDDGPGVDGGDVPPGQNTGGLEKLHLFGIPPAGPAGAGAPCLPALAD